MHNDDHFLSALKERREELRRVARATRLAAEEADDALARADNAIAEVEGAKRALDGFNQSAKHILG